MTNVDGRVEEEGGNASTGARKGAKGASVRRSGWSKLIPLKNSGTAEISWRCQATATFESHAQFTVDRICLWVCNHFLIKVAEKTSRSFSRFTAHSSRLKQPMVGLLLALL